MVENATCRGVAVSRANFLFFLFPGIAENISSIEGKSFVSKIKEASLRSAKAEYSGLKSGLLQIRLNSVRNTERFISPVKVVNPIFNE